MNGIPTYSSTFRSSQHRNVFRMKYDDVPGTLRRIITAFKTDFLSYHDVA